MNSRQLNRWLMQEVHGVDVGLQRKPPRSATSSLGQKPARDWKYRSWIRSLPCVGCGLDPAGEAAHTGSDGGMSQKASDYSCVPLCSDCHTLGPDAYHRIGKAAFEVRRNVRLAVNVNGLNWIWFHPQARNVL
jgi:hypothetical protein